LEGNHRPVLVNLSFFPQVFTPSRRLPWRLKHASAKKYASSCETFFSCNVSENKSLQSSVDFLTDSLKRVATTVVGKCNVSHGHRVQKSWWSAEIDVSVKIRKRLRRKWQRVRTIDCFVDYKSASAVTRRLIVQAKQKSWSIHCSDV